MAVLLWETGKHSHPQASICGKHPIKKRATGAPSTKVSEIFHPENQCI
jgi:hypothetical protein